MFAPRIKLDKDLYARLKAVAAKLGSSSVEEYVKAVLEKELDRQKPDLKSQDRAAAAKDITDKLKGLGYID